MALKHSTDLQKDENQIFEQLIMFAYKKEKKQLKSLRGFSKAKVKCAVNKVNCVLKKIDILNLTELNNTTYAAQHMFLNWLELTNFQRQKMEPWWERRVDGKLNELKRDLDLVNSLLEKRNIKKKHKVRLERKYNIRRKRLGIAREEMKERIKAVAVGAKIKRLNNQ